MASRINPTPVLAKSFQTDALDTGAIHDELNHLWSELGAALWRAGDRRNGRRAHISVAAG